MNFTREPIIETIITPKEGYKLVLRSSKGIGQEEFFVDAIEVISFGNNCFYRSLEKPKCFLIPVGDYEVLEVRETRVVLKSPGVEKGGIKIGGGREASVKTPREPKEEEEILPAEKALADVEAAEQRGDKKRERRRFRKKRGKTEEFESTEEEGVEALEAPFPLSKEIEKKEEEQPIRPPSVSKPREERATLIPPPPTLISETLARYKDTPNFSGAFFEKKEEPKVVEEKHEEENESKALFLEEEEIALFIPQEKDSEDDDDSF